ncbi:MAG: hypothetical protein JJE25_03870, partial [Bacteroidia bacterium]|nr:hypothetical protein [Bacteroidia bacterium]
MNQIQSDELTMLEDVQLLFNDNIIKVNTIPDLKDGKIELDGHITNFKKWRLIQDVDNKGIAGNKNELIKKIITETLNLSGPLVNLGRKTSNNQLIQQFNFSKSSLEALRDGDLVAKASETAGSADLNILALATAGVTPIMVSDLETDNTTLQLNIATPEEARQAKKVATQNIADTFPKTRELMDLTLKPLMRTNFAKNDPDFYNQFITATQIINTGIHHLDFFGLIMDSVTSEAVGSALVRVLSGTTEIAKTKAGEKGHFRF